jgi:hypothetical protein
MEIAFIVVVITTIVMNAGIAVADFARAKFVLANGAEVRVPATWLPALGSLKVAGVVGLLIGLVWLPALAVAAAFGLTLFYVGAIAAHIRARVFYNIAFPGAFLAFAAATLVLAMAQLN